MNPATEVKAVDNKVLLFFIIYITLLVTGVAAIILSAYIQFNKRKDTALIISFTEGKIMVTDELTGITTERDWEWIKRVQLLKETYYFDIKAKRTEVIIMRRNKLSEAEDTALQGWIKEKSKLVL
ncbi:hypothetical protein PaeBR_05155 [Paenibacillus sp. BR2-3]|uniref:hypothetical protein n=1 Tax=Paenibacillus sp. BR2-3 TaxID=3048494 RepID=UPI003977D6F9